MRNRIPALTLMLAVAVAALVSLPADVDAHHYGRRLGHGFGHRVYGPDLYRTEHGSVQIEVESEELRDAQVYVDGAHVGIVDDFDGIFQALRLPPGKYEIGVSLDEDRILRQQIFVSRGRTYKLRVPVEPLGAATRAGMQPIESPTTRAGQVQSPSGAVRIRVEPDSGEAQVYVDGAHAGAVDDFDGVFQRLNLPPGIHEVEIRLTGYRPSRQRVFISSSQIFKLRVRLEPVAPRMASNLQPQDS